MYSIIYRPVLTVESVPGCTYVGISDLPDPDYTFSGSGKRGGPPTPATNEPPRHTHDFRKRSTAFLLLPVTGTVRQEEG
jgi:hypothetical protein